MENANKAIKRFDSCIDFVLAAEGGYVNDKYDAGGETKFGISKKSYPDVDIRNLTLEDAKAIYKKDYWDKCGCGEMPEPLDIVVFDTAVNMGVGRAKQFYAQIEPENSPFMPPDLATRFLELRDEKYLAIVANNPSQKRFLKGWRNRMNHLREFSGLVKVDY